jgi:hypothetical protein
MQIDIQDNGYCSKKLAEQLKHVPASCLHQNVVLHYEGAAYIHNTRSTNNSVRYRAIALRGPCTRSDNREMQMSNAEMLRTIFTTNIESTAVANSVALDVGYEEPQRCFFPGTAPMKELFGFEELGDKSYPRTRIKMKSP